MKNFEKQAEYWKTSSDRDWQSVRKLVSIGRRDMALFFAHLALEKLLKGLIVLRTKESAPFTHHLGNLAEQAGLSPDAEQREHLRVITGFNIAGRYSSDKQDFYRQCAKAFTEENLAIIRPIRLWIKKEYPKK